MNLKYPIKDKIKFFIFGMGLREKLILTEKENGKYQLINYSNNKKIILDDLTNVKIIPEDYKVECTNINKEKIIILENEKGIYIIEKNKTTTISDRKINIPNFEKYKKSKELKILFQEVMVNVTTKGPTPNFIAYPTPWYRDAAIVTMVLEKTDNLSEIIDWINNIETMYDENNGSKEPDNLGEVLYLLSFSTVDKSAIINKILKEAQEISKDKDYISGITDGELHPVYQTKWLKFGMEKLGIDSSKYIIPNILDSYGDLTYFYQKNKTNSNKLNEKFFDKRWPYLYYARLNFYDKVINYNEGKYPLSSEWEPSKANFDNMEIISKYYKEKN